MAYRAKRGMGYCPGDTRPWYQQLFTFSCPTLSSGPYVQPTIVPPPAPTGSVLTTPPASGSDAQATVDSLIAQQKAAQNQQNQQTMAQTLANLQAQAQANCDVAIVDNGDGTFTCPSPSSGFPWGTVAIAGAAFVALFIMSSGTPMGRYR